MSDKIKKDFSLVVEHNIEKMFPGITGRSEEQRNAIRSEILDRWEIEDLDDPNVEPRVVEQLYDLYDELWFNNGIAEYIDGKNITMEFGPIIDEGINDIKCWCGIKCYVDNSDEDLGEITIYNMNITPWEFMRLKHQGPEEDFRMRLMLMFEHNLSHLVGLIFEQYNINRPGDAVRGIHGRLYEVSTGTFFDDVSTSILNTITDPASIPDPDNSHGVYAWWENSCYLDSLIIALLMMKDPTYRRTFFTTNVGCQTYNIVNEKGEQKFLLCQKNSAIKTQEQFRDVVSKFQAYTFDDYHNMITDTVTVQCKSMRALLAMCFPDMKDDDDWDMYPTDSIYMLLCEMFPQLKMPHYQRMRYAIDGRYVDPVVQDGMFVYPPEAIKIPVDENVQEHVFGFWEFMDANTEFDWDEIKNNGPQMLVFENKAGIPIKDYSSADSETFNMPQNVLRRKRFGNNKTWHLPEGWQYEYSEKQRKYYFWYVPDPENNPDGDDAQWDPPEGAVEEDIMEWGVEKVPITYTKARSFGEYILDGRYELVAAEIVIGARPGDEVGGGHYTSYFKNADDEWIYYDDIRYKQGNTAVELNYSAEFPERMLQHKGRFKPVLYFYSKVQQ